MSETTSRASRVALASSLAVLLAGTALSTAAFAQATPAPVPAAPAEAPAQPASPIAAPQSGVASRILVRGNERIDQSTVLSYMGIQPGDPVDPLRIDTAVKTLYRTDLFSDVQITLQGSDLIVQIAENPIINQVVFEGNEALPEKKLREEITVRPRGIFTRSRVQQDVQRIIELYRRSGRIAATVTPKLVELPQRRVDLVFEIDEGANTGVRNITILGNAKFSDSDLRQAMITKTTRWWRPFSPNDNYDPNRLDYDREQLRKYYTNRGYFDFRVVSSIAELSPSNDNFAVTMTVDEGARFNFGELNVKTENEKLNPEFLKALLPIKAGDLYESDKIEDAVDALTFAAGAAGYAFVDIRPQFTPNRQTNTVDVTFNVREGQRVYVERIDIVGNTRTIDPVLRREMNLVEGDAYNQVLVDRSRNQMRALGFFKDVTIEEQPGSGPDRTVLQVNVEEQPTGELSFGAGFSSVDQFLFDFGATERNFRGRGQNLRFRVSVGSLRRQIDLAFTEPRFLGRDLRAGFSVNSYRYDFQEESSFDWESLGGSVFASYPLNGYTLLSGRYNLRQDKIIVPAGYCGAGGFGSRALCEQAGDYVTSLVGYTLNLNRRNDPLTPTRGGYINFRQDFAGVGGDVNYVRTETDGALYYGFLPGLVLTASGSAGYVGGWSGDPVRINDRFFKGGNTFRGFETAGMGPRDLVTRDALGGNFYAIGSMELAFPNGLPEEYGVRTGLFAEMGTLGVLDDRYKLQANGLEDPNIADSLSLRATVGLTVKWRSPMGPIQLDFSQVLAKEDYDKTETFRFSTTTQF